jgi:sirohydrochlorin cobaltochelatase
VVTVDRDQKLYVSGTWRMALLALPRSDLAYAGWFGVECPSVRAAIWLMRALVVSNVLSRREGTVLFVPVNPDSDPDGATVATSVIRLHRLAEARGVL